MRSVSLYVGLDYHSDSIRVCVLTSKGFQSVNRDVANDVESVRRLVLRYGKPAVVAIEACCGAANFAEALGKQTKWTVKLAHPGYVHRLKQTQDKTDCGDAFLLADLARVNYLPEVWLAPDETRELRDVVRYRQQLVADRKDVKLRIRALLRDHRVSLKARAWTKGWREEMFAKPTLPEHSRWVLEQQWKRIDQLSADIALVEKRMAEITANDPLTTKLLEQPGVGLVTAVTLRAEIGRFERFKNGKQFSRYCGLTPRNVSSGKRQADAGLIQSGPPALRALLIQAAQRLQRHEPRWQELSARLRRTKPANVVTAAVANRWLRWLYYQVLTPAGVQLVA